MNKSGKYVKRKGKWKVVLTIVLLTILCGIAVIAVLNKGMLSLESEEPVALPWESGGKPPVEYTWDEFDALEDIQKDLFFESFESADAFEDWMIKAGALVPQETEKVERPWENGGKAPAEYSWEEYQALSPDLQDAFFESFDSIDAFEAWLATADVLVQQTVFTPELPWEQGGKEPGAYTWEEFLNLPEEQMDAFVESFGSVEAFDEWRDMVNPESTVEATVEATVEVTVEQRSCDSAQYTWEEFLALSPEDQEAFFLSFETPEDFEVWMNGANHK